VQLGLFDAPERAGLSVLRGFALPHAEALMAAVAEVTARAPFRHMATPGGRALSAAMSNCGQVGWVTDVRGYRYTAEDPLSGDAWPAMPEVIRDLAVSAARDAGFAFAPDACLINSYAPGARMGLHSDADEPDGAAPIVSVSLGLPATFLFGGLARADPTEKIALAHGDVVVWGGPLRRAYHGVAPLKAMTFLPKEGVHPFLRRRRINLTIRKAL
jgi:alkylated DNA repair protein (DNA oxidative demethylase)